MLVRRETCADTELVRKVHRIAFERSESSAEPPEVGLVEALRRSGEWLSKLSLVAECAGDVIGHVVATRGYLECNGGSLCAVGVGPLGVLPQWQSRGVGAALMHSVLGAADALDEPFAALLGDPAYYARFGFCSAADCGIESPVADWKPYFQIRKLAGWRSGTAGTFQYAGPFRDLE